MAAWVRRFAWFPTLGLICLVLAGLVAARFLPGSHEDAGEPRVPAVNVDAKLLPLPAPPAPTTAGDQSISRPLFSASRRPPPPQPPAAAAPAFKRGQFSLVGTIVADDHTFAFLKSVSSGKVERVMRGAKVAELTLGEVTASSVTLTLGEESEVLPLMVAKGPPRPPPAPARSAAGAAAAGVAAAPAGVAAAVSPPAITRPEASAAQPQQERAAAGPQVQERVGRSRSVPWADELIRARRESKGEARTATPAAGGVETAGKGSNQGPQKSPEVAGEPPRGARDEAAGRKQ